MNSKPSTSKASDYDCSEVVNELRVSEEKFHFEWNLSGFSEIPFINGFPVYSPSFCLGKGSETVWQLLMVKELRFRKTNECVQDGDRKTTENTAIDNEKVSRTTSMSMDTSDSEAAESEVKSTGEKPVCEDETTKNKTRALGFKVIKTEHSSTWEVIKYYVEVKIGGVRKKIGEKVEVCLPRKQNSRFQYLYEEELKGIDINEVDKVCIEAFIEHKFLDLYPLESAGDFEDNQIAVDLYEIYRNPMFCDIILQAGDAEIPANKCILCARSYGFDCHLQEVRKTSKTKLILEIDEEVLRAMLTYIYCGGIPVEFPVMKCLQLYRAGHEFRVPGLRLAVFQFLMKRKNAEIPSNEVSIAEIQFDLIKFSQHGTLEELKANLDSEDRYCRKRIC